MNPFKNFVHGVYKNGYERITPVPTKSTFESERKLTPEEFLRAGDYLVSAFPYWQWSPGDASAAKSYLPKDKQFLIARRVPCRRRAREYGDGCEVNGLAGEEGEGDEWVTAQFTAGASASAVQTVEADVDDDDDDDEDEDNEQVVVGKNISPPGLRNYDLHITWDKYYQVPRFWLVGFSLGNALSMHEVYEDVSADHAGNTITWDRHAHKNIHAASIHPCKHASTMKTLADMRVADGAEFSVEHYLPLFLKFIQSIVPTIEYDYAELSRPSVSQS